MAVFLKSTPSSELVIVHLDFPHRFKKRDTDNITFEIPVNLS
jgi:hypothetical protein